MKMLESVETVVRSAIANIVRIARIGRRIAIGTDQNMYEQDKIFKVLGINTQPLATKRKINCNLVWIVPVMICFDPDRGLYAGLGVSKE